MEKAGSVHGGKEVQKQKGRDKGKKKEKRKKERAREPRVFPPKVVAAPEGTLRAGCPKEDTARAGAAPLSGRRRRGRACRGGLAPERLRRELLQPVFTEPSSGRGGRTGVRVPARGGCRVCRVGVASPSAAAAGAPRVAAQSWCARLRAPRGPFRRVPAPAPRAPPLRPRRASDVAAERRGASLRLSAAWHLADAPWAAGRRGQPSGSPRGPPPPASARPWSSPRAPPPPPARAACPQSRQPAAPCAGPAAEPGPPARPVRDGEPGRLSRRSARPPRGGRSRRRAAAPEWRYPAAAIPETGLGKVPPRTLGPPAPPPPAPARARPLGIRSASCAFASASSTRFWAPRGTTWAPCAFCSR